MELSLSAFLQRLKADEVILILNIEGMEPQVLNTIDIATLISKALLPEVSTRQVQKINSQAGLPLVQGNSFQLSLPVVKLLNQIFAFTFLDSL